MVLGILGIPKLDAPARVIGLGTWCSHYFKHAIDVGLGEALAEVDVMAISQVSCVMYIITEECFKEYRPLSLNFCNMIVIALVETIFMWY